MNLDVGWQFDLAVVLPLFVLVALALLVFARGRL